MTEAALQPVRISERQRADFERDGFLVVPGALPEELVQQLTAVVDRLFAEGVATSGLSGSNHYQLRNCLVRDPLFLQLLDWPATFPLVAELLNENIQLCTSHMVVRAPSPPGVDASWKAEGWHRDGGTSWRDMKEPHPRLFVKVAYWLTDLSETGRGSIRFVPGSNRLIGPPAQAEGAPDPYGAVEIKARAGDAVLFEQRTYHAVGPNFSDITRKSLFFGYCYRWIRPMDYSSMPADILARCSPVQKQLLGHAATEMGYYLPTEEDVPLRARMASRT